MEGGIGVEIDGCEGSNCLGGKQWSFLIFLDLFSTNRPQNKPLQVIVQDVIIHPRDVLMLIQDPTESIRIDLEGGIGHREGK